jgi:hypothetical protein
MRYPTYKVTLDRGGESAVEEFEVYIDLMLDEADSLLKWTGMTWNDWVGAVDKREPDALRFLYWLARKRADRPIDGKFSSINFYLHQLTNELSDPGDMFTLAAEPDVEGTAADPTEGVETVSN